jgi:hypothetical protein
MRLLGSVAGWPQGQRATARSEHGGVGRKTPTRPRLRLLVVMATLLLAGCAPPLVAYTGARRPRGEVAVIESGDVTVQQIDDMKVRYASRYEVLPGPHDLVVLHGEPRTEYLVVRMLYTWSLGVCLKARPGGTYVIRIVRGVGDRRRAMIIDKATGILPKTPCGPDESDDE